jgi:Tol biopolymer transport system component
MASGLLFSSIFLSQVNKNQEGVPIMKKTRLLCGNHFSLALLILIICFTPNQFIISGINFISMFEPAEGVIVFQTERHGTNEEIYIMNADGSGQTRLTFNNFRDVCPSISPDGRKIVFSSNRDGDYEIYIMNCDGSNQQRLTTSVGFDLHPDWSPDGSKIAFFSERDGNYEIYVMEANGSNQTRLTFNTWQDQLPDWLPNSSFDSLKILFTSNQTGTYGIYKMNADGTDIQVVYDGPIQELMGRWSPDGNKIVFVKMIDWNSQRDVWLMDSDGSDEVQLTINPAIDEDACWSPDGMKIAFQSDRNGSYQLFTMNPDGSDQTVIPNSHNDYWPSWGIDTTQTGINENQKSEFGFQLYQNYPNPFNPSTKISYQIQELSYVTLKIYNVLGNELATLVEEEKPAGNYEISFNAFDITSGIYFYQLKTESYLETKKMVLMK